MAATGLRYCAGLISYRTTIKEIRSHNEGFPNVFCVVCGCWSTILAVLTSRVAWAEEGGACPFQSTVNTTNLSLSVSATQHHQVSGRSLLPPPRVFCINSESTERFEY